MRALPVALAACAFLLAAPATAAADVVFDPADADDLAATLAEAHTTQDVCYGWQVTVQDVYQTEESVGSNFGAGKPVTDGSCSATVEFTATITYTSESSESEDSAYYDVSSNPTGVRKSDLDGLGIDWGELTGENPDVVIGKAVTALPLLAADAGLAEGIQAAPASGSAPADARLTDNPGGDWWRKSGGMLMWGLALIAAGALFAWWVVRVNRNKVAAAQAAEERARRRSGMTRKQRARDNERERDPIGAAPPPYVPPKTTPEPPTQPIARPGTTGEPTGRPSGPPTEGPTPAGAAPVPPTSTPADPTPGAAPGETDEPGSARPAPPDQNTKE